MIKLAEKIINDLQNGEIICLKEEYGPSQGYTAEEWEQIPSILEHLKKNGDVKNGKSPYCYLWNGG